MAHPRFSLSFIPLFIGGKSHRYPNGFTVGRASWDILEFLVHIEQLRRLQAAADIDNVFGRFFLGYWRDLLFIHNLSFLKLLSFPAPLLREPLYRKSCPP